MATNDVHYLRHEDAHAHDALLCIQTQSNLDDENRMRFGTDEFYLKTAEEMRERFADYPERLRRHGRDRRALRRRASSSAATCCRRYPVPEGTPRTTLPARAVRGTASCAATAPTPAPEVRERLEFELGVIGEMGFSAYFLIVWDFVKFAKDNGIAVGPGRGSAAG